MSNATEKEGTNLAGEVIAILENDRVKAAGGHSITDTWHVLKDEAKRHGYTAHLTLPYDVDNLEISYTDPQGKRAPIYTTLFSRGEACTVYQGLRTHHEISNDIPDQTAALRGAIKLDVKNKSIWASAASVFEAIDTLPPDGRKTAAARFPELVKAFALEAAVKSFAKCIENPDGREAFTTRIRQNILDDLRAGRPIADVRVHQGVDNNRQSQQQGRDR